jgi:acyl-CoA:acyl-CoA alkyltransferase
MKIASIAYRIPSRKITNDALIEHISQCNPEQSALKKIPYLKLVEKLLTRTGAQTRYWRDIEAGERGEDLILGAMDEAIDRANISAQEIDLLIYCGVGKGFLEPANAYFYARSRGMKTANCFDITDACMSWTRAVQMAYLMLKAGSFKAIAIINGEFHVGLHDNWEIRDFRSLEYTFPMYTIGEAATATILLPSDDEWQFDYSSRSEFADLCTIPLNGYENFVSPGERIGKNGIDRFVSYGQDLFREGEKCLGELMDRSIDTPASKVWYFPHAPSKTVYEEFLPKRGVPVEKIYLEVYPRFGNVVSASVPLGIRLAEAEGKLKRGDPICLVPVSAGLVASVVQLTY